MTPRLWEMSDQELAALRDRAQLVLNELYLKHSGQMDQVELLKIRLRQVAKRSEVWHKYERWLFSANRDLDQTEQRIAAQRSYLKALDNEINARNPRRWTRTDLERINRHR